jgi:4'-phosphopantetheinyl transferase
VAVPVEIGDRVAVWQRVRERPPRLEPRAIHVWRVEIGQALPDAVLCARCELLSADEVERAGRLKTRVLRDRYVLCRGALRRLLGDYMGRAPRTLVFEYGPSGKPALRTGRAAGEAPIEFNVSHADDLALIALTRTRRVGIDVERIRSLPDADGLVRRFFAPAEQARYMSLPAESRTLAFFRCWTRKEAVVKASGHGLSQPLDEFEVSLGPDEPARLLRIPGLSNPSEGWSLHSFQPVPGHTAAVAATRGAVTLSFFAY